MSTTTQIQHPAHRSCTHVNADGYDLLADRDDYGVICFACGYTAPRR